MAKTILTGRFLNCYWQLKINLSIFLLLINYLSISQPFDMDTIWWSGPADRRINLVFLGDGYQETELDQFIKDVQRVTQHFFSQSPFKEYQSYFNLVAIKVPSKESGAKKDPSETRETYFGSSYNFAGIDRLLVAGNPFAAQQILFDQFPLFDQAILIVNDEKYGGSGGWLATTSIHESAPEIALHEIGHSFAGLADEYWAGEQFAGEKPNMTRLLNPDLLRWKNWLSDQGIGVYLHQEDPAWARPHENCKMRVLNPDFCAVCREALVKRIHDLTMPIAEYHPDLDPLVLADEDSLIFQVDFLEPSPNSLNVYWSVDQSVYAKYEEFVANKEWGEGEYTIHVFVSDTTHFVRDPVHTSEQTYSLTWELKIALSTTNLEITPGSSWSIYPNPTSDQIILEMKGKELREFFAIEIRDATGRPVYKDVLLDKRHFISLANYPPGIYWLMVSSKDGYAVKNMVKIP